MNVLAMVAHPDDEALGAGGTLARHAAHGDDVFIAYLTNGVGARDSDSQAENARIEMSRKAAAILGAKLVDGRLFPDNQLDSVPLLYLIHAVERYVTLTQPEVIYTHHAGDLNIDHRICNQAVLTACRPMKGSSVKAIHAIEVPSSTEWQVPNSFQPNMFVDVESTMPRKSDALKAYGDEMRPFPHPRSYEGIVYLARWRGASVGLEYAEAFMVLREIV